MSHLTWAIVPAAGIGRRMKSDIPKQYLLLNGRPVLEYTINALLQNDNITGVVVALQADDPYWSDIKIDSQKSVIRVHGGAERTDSVLNAIEVLCQLDQFDKTDWVMVHDAVRPCLRQEDIDRLVSEVGDDSNGGLLALQVRDTIKRQRKDTATMAATVTASVETTIDRKNLWHALTPQYFPALELKSALIKAEQNELNVTDDSSAMESVGFSPKLIPGKEDNIKITRPDDLRLAELYLQAMMMAQDNPAK